jgi:hypothetical protein
VERIDACMEASVVWWEGLVNRSTAAWMNRRMRVNGLMDELMEGRINNWRMDRLTNE